ncbi:MAG: hypothetical protein Q8O55_01420 [Dehalococcoidales bacterium]|nr:hypothetical protein [Dehalococcoidales bacterium]
MSDWFKVGAGAVTGAVAGVADQVVQNMDEKRALDERAAGRLAVDKKLPLMQQFGTYLNYGVPILTVLASAMGWVKGDVETRLVTAAGQLAGRKATHQLTTGAKSNTPSAAYTAWNRAEVARQAGRSAQPEFDKVNAFSF